VDGSFFSVDGITYLWMDGSSFGMDGMRMEYLRLLQNRLKAETMIQRISVWYLFREPVKY
jgi:hypothetical protein